MVGLNKEEMELATLGVKWGLQAGYAAAHMQFNNGRMPTEETLQKLDEEHARKVLAQIIAEGIVQGVA